MQQSNLARVENAHARREYFVEIHQKSSLVELKLMYEMFANKDWDKLGFERWSDYVEAPVESGGLGVSREWATQLVQVYRRYIIELGLPEERIAKLSPRKLYQIKGAVNSGNVDDMLHKVASMSLRDLSLEMDEIDTYGCQHPHAGEVADAFIKCPDCRQFVKVRREI